VRLRAVVGAMIVGERERQDESGDELAIAVHRPQRGAREAQDGNSGALTMGEISAAMPPRLEMVKLAPCTRRGQLSARRALAQRAEFAGEFDALRSTWRTGHHQPQACHRDARW